MQQLNSVLAGLNIDGSCVAHNTHRHLATFDVELKPGALVKRIESRTREIALGIKSRTAPIVKLLPDRGLVRLQVAMKDSEALPLFDLFNKDEIPSTKENLLPIILGESDEGKKVCIDLSQHPHTLVAGTTGSGKSVFLRSLIANIVYLNSVGARKIQLYLSDPKRVEFNVYEKTLAGIVPYVAYDYGSTIAMLEEIQDKMEARYEELAKRGLSSVADKPALFPSIVVIIDEVADLMVMDKKLKRFESLVVRLAQKARAAGIYLVLATQRPSVDVLTGLIKASFPGRVAFKVSSKTDSQVILDGVGAESLLGRGDAILQSPVNDRIRFQAAFCDAKQIIASSL